MKDPNRTTDANAPGREARRRFITDREGTVWEIREMKNPDYDRRGGYSLIFESVGAVRRVRQYPAEWFELPATTLLALSDRI